MHARQEIPATLVALAVLQGGVVTREQALALGLSESAVTRLVRQGHWQRLASGVYLTSPLPADWLAVAWAGVLIGGDAARLAGSAAGHLHGLTLLQPREVDVLVPHDGRRVRVTGPWHFIRETRSRGPSVGSPPRTSVEDTVLDLLADPDLSEAKVVGLLTDAIQRRLTTSRRLRRVLEERARHPRRRLLTEVLADTEAGVRSQLERRYLRDVERAHGLPVGRRQVRRDGAEADVLYDEFALLVELDGRLGHDGSGRFKDMSRDNAALVQGLATLRFGHHDVAGTPCDVAVMVGQTLNRRGWTGVLLACPRCRRAHAV